MRFRRPDGRPAKLRLGDLDPSGKEAGDPVMGAPLTLAGARELAAKIQRERKAGADVVADHEAEKHRQKTEGVEASKNSYGTLLRQFISERARPKLRRWRDVARLLGLVYPKEGDGEPSVIAGGLAQRWADKPVRSFDGHDIFAVMDEARRRGIPGLEKRSDGPSDSSARAVLTALSSFFGWAWKNRFVDSNPCASVHRPDAAKARDRVLSESEIVAFWGAADAQNEPFAQALKLLLLTGARENEVAGMRRGELSEDLTMWEIPGSRTKNKRPHRVPLSPMARDILATIKPISGGLVFTTTGRTPISGWSKLKARLDDAMQIAGWRLHDLRRTVSTGMNDLGIQPHVVEATLNHVSGVRAGVAGVYNRAAYSDEKRVALERWATHIEGLVSGRSANVVSLSGKSTAG
jgi:integrase